MKSPNPAYYRVQLTRQQELAASQSLTQHSRAQLWLDVEIVELSQGMQALAWIWVQGGSRAGTLRRCTLSPAQWAECSLALRAGDRPVYRVSWELLGQLEDGIWGATDGRVSALESMPADDWGKLDELTGVSDLG